MIYSRQGDKVTVEFTIGEYAELQAILGAALILSGSKPMAVDVSRFIMEINRTNTDYDIYEALTK